MREAPSSLTADLPPARFAIVTDWPRVPVEMWRVVWRLVGPVIGLVLLAVAVVAVILPVYSVVVPMSRPLSLGGSDLGLEPLNELGIPFIVQVLLEVGLAAGTFGAGWALICGRRHVVLFLRRFGHGESTATMSAAARSIGRRWRMVTLDDAAIAPIGPGRAVSTTVAMADRATSLAEWLADVWARVASVCGQFWSWAGDVLTRLWKWGALIGLGAMACAWLVLSARSGTFVHASDDLVPSAGSWPPEGYLFAAGLLTSMVLLAVPLAVLVVGLAFGCIAMWTVRPILVGIGEVLSEVSSADESRRIVLTSDVDLERATRQVEESRSSPFHSRLAVLTVDSIIWRDTVTTLAQSSTAVLVDISVPTPHVLWEIEQVTAARPGRCVLVGEIGCLRHLAHDRLDDPEEKRLVELSREHVVLAYAPGWRGRRRFHSALRRRLAHSALDQ